MSRKDPGDADRVVLDYLEVVRHRTRRPPHPDGFTPDWADRPLPHTHYRGAARIPLPLIDEPRPPEEPREPGAWDLAALAVDLRASIGIASRRLQIDANADLDERTAVATARWGRGTPSGGGTYPIEVYWAAGPGAPLAPGILHYATGLHALERLTTGDPTEAVRAALGRGADDTDDQFLLCTVRQWKNSFKYHNLAHLLAILDLGAFTASWEMLCRDRNIPHRRHVWFADHALNELLGLDPAEESVHAVLPLAWRSTASRGRADEAPARTSPTRRPSPYERSRRIRRFPLTEAVRRATEQPPPPVPGRPLAASLRTAAPRLTAAEVLPPVGEARAALARRVSASGRMDGARPLEQGLLTAVLAAALPEPGALCGTGEPAGLTGMSVLARRVTGLAPGPYAYRIQDGALVRAPGAGPEAFTEDQYQLANYALGDAAALLVPHWHPVRAVKAHGPRAYRTAGVEAGAAAQRAHLAATHLGLAAGLLFGVDAVALDHALGLRARGRHSLVVLLMGHPLPGTAALDGRLC
ncbi:nitroreductase family protein [Streptomyces sp. HMX87]|uniref:nitroreductase family protein n=1 Tax=Streptomyces sp. HMX87 TaxID=3390849 RepID=UPI003A8A61B1